LHGTNNGNSGCPVLIFDSDSKKYFVIGVHKGTSSTENYCVILNK